MQSTAWDTCFAAVPMRSKACVPWILLRALGPCTWICRVNFVLGHYFSLHAKLLFDRDRTQLDSIHYVCKWTFTFIFWFMSRSHFKKETSILMWEKAKNFVMDMCCFSWWFQKFRVMRMIADNNLSGKLGGQCTWVDYETWTPEY